MVPGNKMTREELKRAIRLDIAAELEAVHLYTAHANATDDPLAKAVLKDIAKEEQVHAYEFLQLIRILEPEEMDREQQGINEVAQIACELLPEDKRSGICQAADHQ